MASVGSGSADDDPTAGRPPTSPSSSASSSSSPSSSPQPSPDALGGYRPGRGQVPPVRPYEQPMVRPYEQPPVRPHDTFTPYVAPPVARRRRGDWQVLVFALVVAVLVMAACCIAGFAVFVKHGGTFG